MRMPHSLETEQSLLTACLLHREALEDVADLLRPDDFYNPGNRVIFASALRLNGKNEPVDVTTVANELQARGQLDAAGGIMALSRLCDSVPMAASVPYYAGIIRDKAQKRRMIALANKTMNSCMEDSEPANALLDDLQKAALAASDHAGSEKCYQGMPESVQDALNHFEAISASRGGVTGVTTGFGKLDVVLGGLQPSDLIILAARPGMGKTAFSLNVARNAAKAGSPVLFFSLEMSRAQLMNRLLATESGINSSRLRSGPLTQDDLSALVDAAAGLYEAPLYIDDSPALSVDEIQRRTRRAVKAEGIKLVVVDYLGLCRGERGHGRVEEVGSISGGLKALAKGLNLPVLALSQLNRESEHRDNKRPRVSDLRDSGSLEQDADVVLLLFREHQFDKNADPEAAELEIAKQRSGPTPRLTLKWDPRRQLFREPPT